MRLSDRFIELFAYTAYLLRSLPERQPVFEQVNSDIHRLIIGIEQKARESSISLPDFEQAKFAVYAWIDEAVMRSAWKEKDKWQQDSLQKKYFNIAEAGEIFFERLNSLGPHQRDVREIYYLCLALGFKGRYYRPEDKKPLEGLKAANLKELLARSMGTSSFERGPLFPEAYAMESTAETNRPPTRRLSSYFWIGLGVPVVLFFCLYIVFWLFLNMRAADFLK